MRVYTYNGSKLSEVNLADKQYSNSIGRVVENMNHMTVPNKTRDLF